MEKQFGKIYLLNGILVLCTETSNCGRFSGVVIESSNEDILVGEYSNGWYSYKFELFEGKISIDAKELNGKEPSDRKYRLAETK